MNFNLTLIEENPDKLKSDDIYNIVQKPYIWHNDGHRWRHHIENIVKFIIKP